MDYVARNRQRFNELAKTKTWTQEELTPGLIVRFETMLGGSSVLDLGSGTGRDSLRLKRYGLYVQGLDIAENMIEIARSEVGDLHVVRGDFRNIPFEDDSFDGVWANQSLGYLSREDLPVAIVQIHRVLKAGGIVYASFEEGEGEQETNGILTTRYLADELREVWESHRFRVFDLISTSNLVHIFARRQGTADKNR